MYNSKITRFKIPSLNAFDFQIRHTETDKKSHTLQIDLHTHSDFEIYVNLSGDVSFLVENNLYALTYGDVIIARPGEHHHCVYRSDAPHKHFWILFDCEKNPQIVDFFFRHPEINFISLTEASKAKLISICNSLSDKETSPADRLYYFLELIKLLETDMDSSSFAENRIPEDFSKILDYIDENITQNIRISDITAAFFCSTSTIERSFKEYVDLKPLEYIQRKKLFLAAKMLRNGESVSTAGLNVGYTDNSYFIQLFKRQFGITPYQYKKRCQHK